MMSGRGLAGRRGLLHFRLDEAIAKHDLRGLRHGGGGRHLGVAVVGAVQLGCRLQAVLEANRGNFLVLQRLLQVHDELVFEIAEKDLTRAEPLITKIMETITSLSVPLVVEANSGKTWADI